MKEKGRDMIVNITLYSKYRELQILSDIVLFLVNNIIYPITKFSLSYLTFQLRTIMFQLLIFKNKSSAKNFCNRLMTTYHIVCPTGHLCVSSEGRLLLLLPKQCGELPHPQETTYQPYGSYDHHTEGQQDESHSKVLHPPHSMLKHNKETNSLIITLFIEWKENNDNCMLMKCVSSG